MNLIVFHVLHAAPSADFGLARYAAPALDPEARVFVWEGLPPPALPDRAHVAPVVLQGDVDGHRAYVERVPRGLPLSAIAVPASRARWIALAALRGLDALHEQELVHGNVSIDRLFLGTRGEVVWIGRGRRAGDITGDRDGIRGVLRALGVDSSSGLDATRDALERDHDPVDAAVIGTLVEGALHEMPVHLGPELHLQVGPGSESLDEVVPDFGPDTADEPGLLDRWSAGTPRDRDTTAERTAGEVARSDASLALTLWTRLGAPPEHPAPADRFDGLGATPSAAVRALLRQEVPEGLPALLSGDVGPFVLAGDFSTEDGERTDPAFSDPEPTPDSPEDEGDTAIYDRREAELREAIRKADHRTAIAQLEARLLDAERRARDAERKLKAVGEATPPPAPAAAPPPAWTEAGQLSGFLRIEVVVAATLGALAMWLTLRSLGLA